MMFKSTRMTSIVLTCVLIGVLYGPEFSSQQQESQIVCPLKKYCPVTSLGVECHFERFDQIVFNYSNCSGVFNGSDSIGIYANTYQIMDLNKFNLFEFIQFTFSQFKYIDRLRLKYLSGFVLTDQYPKYGIQAVYLIFMWVEFRLFSLEEKSSIPIELSLDCSGYRKLSAKQKTQIQLFWNTFNDISLTNIGLPARLCPSVFDNVNMSTLSISFPKPGQHLVFEQDNQTMIRADIKELKLSGWHMITLDKRLIHPQVFANLERFSTDGTSLKSIELDLFKDFLNLKVIIFSINNMKTFYHNKQGGTKWIQYLNYYKESLDFRNKTTLSENDLNLIGKNYLMFSHNKPISASGNYGIRTYADYFYPDSDFCLFDKFPFERVVIFHYLYHTHTNFTLNCSCTIRWLFQYTYLYEQASIYHSQIIECLNNQTEFENSLVECDFKKKIALCEINYTVSYTDDIYISSYYLDKTIKQIKLIVLGQMQSVVSLIGVVSNVLALLTILYNWHRKAELMNKHLNKSEEVYLLREPLYKQMLNSSVANSLYCLLFFLNSVIPCDTMGQPLICFNKDLGISIVLSFLKLVSNFCLLQMSVHRYLLVGKQHHKILERIGSVKTKIFVIVVLAVSSGLSSITYVEQISWAPVRKIDGKYNERSYYYRDAFSYYDHAFSPSYNDFGMIEYLKRLNQVTLVFCLVILNDLFSYFLYCLISLVLDLITIKKLKQTIKEKEKTGGANFDKEKFTQVERKGITMVVLSSLFNFFLRMPELASIVVLYYLVTQGNISVFYTCMFENDCVSLVSISDVFYMLSISTNLVFYVKFNSNFKASFVKLINRAICRNES